MDSSPLVIRGSSQPEVSTTSSLKTWETLPLTPLSAPAVYLNVEESMPPLISTPKQSPDQTTPRRLSDVGITQEDMDNSHDISIYGVAGSRRYYLDGMKVCNTMTCKKCYGCKSLSRQGRAEMRTFMKDMEEDFWNTEDTDPEDDPNDGDNEEEDPTYEPSQKRLKVTGTFENPLVILDDAADE